MKKLFCALVLALTAAAALPDAASAQRVSIGIGPGGVTVRERDRSVVERRTVVTRPATRRVIVTRPGPDCRVVTTRTQSAGRTVVSTRRVCR